MPAGWRQGYQKSIAFRYRLQRKDAGFLCKSLSSPGLLQCLLQWFHLLWMEFQQRQNYWGFPGQWVFQGREVRPDRRERLDFQEFLIQQGFPIQQEFLIHWEFPVQQELLIHRGFPVRQGFLIHWEFLVQKGFPVRWKSAHFPKLQILPGLFWLPEGGTAPDCRVPVRGRPHMLRKVLLKVRLPLVWHML